MSEGGEFIQKPEFPPVKWTFYLLKGFLKTQTVTLKYLTPLFLSSETPVIVSKTRRNATRRTLHL